MDGWNITLVNVRRNFSKTSVSETIRKPRLVKAQTALKNKK